MTSEERAELIKELTQPSNDEVSEGLVLIAKRTVHGDRLQERIGRVLELVAKL